MTSNNKTPGKFKNFCVGLGLAGVASIGLTNNPQAQGGCAGMCSQCGTCCFGILSLGLWLVEKRWHPFARMRLAVAHRFNGRSHLVSGFDGKEMYK
ncbi:MAG: hypothetical protein P8Z37_07570 [Acidobacteriota bacterium]